jgi:hypothetical protein
MKVIPFFIIFVLYLKTGIMKGFIKLTTIGGSEIRIKIDHIGHYYNSNNSIRDKGTVVGVTTHNNGGFKVKQTADEIDELIRINRLQ